ncbi:hypothetical protein J4N02_13810 [Propioniciclava sp. MC1595]|uniref:Fis family transcriptional regulator n=1 Tax=Propioniciclava sp. MC1595 TaxID=2760308 RepID=UPI0016626B67|nr:Fis family transcriptional regulator [Propioniciclava sp. MC1595]MBB1494943.1 Fis family transcriptional regulator [Propioniciclava sp. MC1595]QTE25563.1 hypothetical protein J4N02_13810 [Propioniciclava sp. MC1595]
MTSITRPRARFEATGPSLQIEALTITDDAVLRECRHWATGERGPAADADALAGADLTSFVMQAMTIGATALTTAGTTQTSYSVENLIADAEKRSTAASELATQQTAKAVETASKTLTQATADTAKQVAESLEKVTAEVTREIGRLVGGEDPELMRRLQPLLDTTMQTMKEATLKDTAGLLDKVARQFNPADPASPMAVQMRTLTEAQEKQAEVFTAEQKALMGKVDELTAAIRIKQAHDHVVASTALKGVTYEESTHAALSSLAAGLGDEYHETGTITGLKTRSKKGDGVLSLQGGDTRVVIEMTDSARPRWTDYLREAEENRGALASLGLAKSTDQLGGQTLLVLGPRRLVLAYDPESDDTQLLRCALLLLRQAAEAAASRVDSGEIATADEALAEALTKLEQLDRIRKNAGLIRRGADAIETDATTLQTELLRLLSKARSVLAGVPLDAGAPAA